MYIRVRWSETTYTSCRQSTPMARPRQPGTTSEVLFLVYTEELILKWQPEKINIIFEFRFHWLIMPFCHFKNKLTCTSLQAFRAVKVYVRVAGICRSRRHDDDRCNCACICVRARANIYIYNIIYILM